jgi:hypothetical protein
MKTYTILLSLVILFAACEKNEIPPTTSPSDDDMVYSFDTEIYSEFSGIESGIYSCINESYPNAEWTIRVQMRGSAASTEIVEFTTAEEGFITYAFTHEWFIGDNTDTIIGTGYFDADTAYLNYTYQQINEDGILYGEPIEVNIHSL